MDLALFSALIRFQIRELVIQMVDCADSFDCLVSDRISGCLMLLFQQCFQGIGEIPSRMRLISELE